MKKIRLGQIGIGHNHGEGKMRAVRKFPELFEIVGYAEPNEEWIKKRGGLDCYSDLERMSEEVLLEKCDAVLVETDVPYLTETAKRCVDKGVHVHIDKPASGTLEEYAQLLETAKRKNLTVQLGYMYRYNHAVKKCMDMIQSGKLGEIYKIDAEMSTYHPDGYRRWLSKYPGGSMYIFGSHLIDLIVTILGEPQNVVPFVKHTGFHGVESDDNCVAVLDYPRATAVVTNLSVEVNGWGMRRFAVFGSLGTVEIKPIECDVCMTASLDPTVNAYEDIHTDIDIADVPQNTRYDDMLCDFYLSVVGEKPNPYSYEHELAVQRVLLKACAFQKLRIES